MKGFVGSVSVMVAVVFVMQDVVVEGLYVVGTEGIVW